jgi:hypothetical protein
MIIHSLTPVGRIFAKSMPDPLGLGNARILPQSRRQNLPRGKPCRQGVPRAALIRFIAVAGMPSRNPAILPPVKEA